MSLATLGGGLAGVLGIGTPGSAQEAPPAAGVDAQPESEFDPRCLLAEPLPASARLGLALRSAENGMFEEAAAAVDELRDSPGCSDPLRGRLARESLRLHDLAQWRRDFVEQWKNGTKKLQIEHDGRATTGTLKDIEGQEVVLLDTKGREMRLALAALDAEQILRRCTEAKLEIGSGAVRAYAALVAGRKNWERPLPPDPTAAELKTDAAGWSSLLAQGEMAARVLRLAHARIPVNDGQASPLLAELRPLLGARLGAKDASKELATIIDPRRASLRRFASICLGKQFDAAGIAGAGLKGHVLAKADGVVRLTYTFDRPVEAEDWTPCNTVVLDRQGKNDLKTSLEESWARIEDGVFRSRGVIGWISNLEFIAPMTVAWKYTTHPPDPKNPTEERLTVRVSLCDDGKTSRAEAIDFFGVQSIDTASRFHQTQCDLKAYVWGQPLQALLTHDGKNVTYAVEGKPDHTVPCGPRTSGHVGLWINSDAIVEFDEVEIEGRLEPHSLARLRTKWVEQRLAELEAADVKPVVPEKPKR